LRPLTEEEERRIAATIAAGMTVKALHESQRFRGASFRTLSAIADKYGVIRRKCPAPRRKDGG